MVGPIESSVESRGVADIEIATCPRPELLAPAGDWECVKAAVENGADAIYFGLERFNARMRANNFTEADLPTLMAFLHRRGVKGYVTFNTLVFAHELADADQYLRSLISAGVDAIIVQDVGICRLIRKLSPDLPIHASTQMTISSAVGVEFARDLGCSLVVLARECSIKDIASVKSQVSDIPLEIFIHGALCVAYSGQCLTSEALGGRSANRGECAQACRMPYDLLCDEKYVPLGDRQYLLSPQDLSGIEVLPELIRAGVASLKIEGRLKSAEYVANITRVYREALDKVMGFAGRDELKLQKEIREESRYDLEMAFSRGLYTGWLRGPNNQQLVHARFGKKRGVLLGEVSRVDRGLVYLKLLAPLKPGDGVVFDAGHPDQNEQGGRVYDVSARREDFPESAVGFGHGDVDFKKIHPGDKVWKTSDPELDRRLRQTYAGETPIFQRPIACEVYGKVGQPMTLVVRDEGGHVVQINSQMPLVAAQKQPLTKDRLRDQLGRLGGTGFKLGELKDQLEGEVMLPMSELNRMRRTAVSELDVLRVQPKRWKLNDYKFETPEEKTEAQGKLGEPELLVLVRSLVQLDVALQSGIQTIYCEFEDPKKFRNAMDRVVQSRSSSYNPQMIAAPPRIFKPGEDWILKIVRSCNADGYLVRNYDHLKYFAGEKMIGDFSLNVANRLSAEYFLERFGLQRLTASYDLNIVQLEALLKSAPPQWFEVTIHQHIPMFHMDHCLFCAFLSKGTDYTNCGRPCDKHAVKLRDRVGQEHLVKADAGCRNTVFNGRAQTGADYVVQLLTLGVRHFRVEFVEETAGDAARTIAKYRALLRGEVSGVDVWHELKLWNQLGVTRGPMASQTGR